MPDHTYSYADLQDKLQELVDDQVGSNKLKEKLVIQKDEYVLRNQQYVQNYDIFLKESWWKYV